MQSVAVAASNEVFYVWPCAGFTTCLGCGGCMLVKLVEWLAVSNVSFTHVS